MRRRDAYIEGVHRWLTSSPRRPSKRTFRDLVGNDGRASRYDNGACGSACDPHPHMMTAAPNG